MSLLAHPAEGRTVACMALATAVAALHWTLGQFHPVLFAAGLVLAFAVSTMNHNHSHRPIWRHNGMNRATDLWFTLFQGHPGYVFETMHVDNHHRFHNDAQDVTRTDRYRPGNDLWGLLRHPFEFAWAAAPRIGSRLRAVARADRRELGWILAQYLLLLGLDGLALWLDWRAACYVVLAPQAAAMFWLLASNYLQHAHAHGASQFDHARNFLGAVNVIGFNVGYHTAHHHDPQCHWSDLPDLHRRLAARIDARLNERSLLGYCGRVFFLALLLPRYRSRPLAGTPLPGSTE